MDVIEAIEKRRSIRQYKPDPIPEAVLEQVLSAVRLAPSGKNYQPWKFIVVRDAEMKKEIAAACSWYTPFDRAVAQDWVADAPVIVVACGHIKEAAVKYYEDERVIIARRATADKEGASPADYESTLPMDLAIALDHLTLAAVEHGLGTCWVAGLDEQKLKALLKIPEDVWAPVVMPLGYPVSWPNATKRKPLEEIIAYETYGVTT